ncbi:hypothetical protein GQ53DRAFT_884617, partial [Thozetella sp. PMI_491]
EASTRIYRASALGLSSSISANNKSIDTRRSLVTMQFKTLVVSVLAGLAAAQSGSSTSRATSSAAVATSSAAASTSRAANSSSVASVTSRASSASSAAAATTLTSATGNRTTTAATASSTGPVKAGSNGRAELGFAAVALAAVAYLL